MFGLDPLHIFGQQIVVGRTEALPEMEGLFRDKGGHIAPQVAIRCKDDFFGVEGPYHLDRVGTGTANVRFGLGCRSAIDVGHHGGLGEALFHLAQPLCGNHVCHGTAGVGAG